MAAGQQVNTQRVITIAGAVALIAITAFGVWKWNKATGKKAVYNKKKIRGKNYCGLVFFVNFARRDSKGKMSSIY